MSALRFEGMKHDTTGNGIASVSDVYGGLQFTPNDELCVGLMHTGTKPLEFYFAIFKPDYSTEKFIQFDIRELASKTDLTKPVGTFDIPLKAYDKLAFIVDTLENSFKSEHELLAAIVETKSEAIQL